MRLAPMLISALGLLSACANSPAPAPAAADTSTTVTSAPAPAAAPCGPNAYRHEGPDFCVELPASARGKAPTAFENGIAFPGISFEWAPKSNAAKIAEWKAPKPAAQHHGRFEIWTTEPVPRGTYFVIFDATQHDTQDIDKIPSVRGTTIVEGETTAVRCTVTLSVEREKDARAVAESHAKELEACKSLRLFGRS